MRKAGSELAEQSLPQLLAGLMQIQGQLAQSTPTDPKQIESRIGELSQTREAVPDTITGLLPALIELVKGKGFSPLAPQKRAIGEKRATKRFEIEQDQVQQLGTLLNQLAQNIQRSSQIKISEAKESRDIEKAPAELKRIQTSELKAAKELERIGLLNPGTLFQRFEAASKNFIAQRDAFSRIQTLVSNDPTPISDVGIVFSIMKLFDPPSTVREGEQATARNASAVPDRIRNVYNAAIAGQQLTPTQRNQFLSTAQTIFNSAEKQQAKTTKQFAELAKRNKIDPSAVIRDVGLATAAGIKIDVTKELKVVDGQDTLKRLGVDTERFELVE